MRTKIQLEITPQPDDFTCGPACLYAVYRFYGDQVELLDLIAQVERVEGGGTLAVILANHALKRGYKATIYTYNVQVFDPTWFNGQQVDISERLSAQMAAKPDRSKLQSASRAYLEFLSLGGVLRQEELTPSLIRKYLQQKIPLLTGLSAAYLYRCARERLSDEEYDDIRGEPQGHFVVLAGYDSRSKEVRVADPLQDNPTYPGHIYEVPVARLINAILLGILTHDADLVVLEQPDEEEG